MSTQIEQGQNTATQYISLRKFSIGNPPIDIPEGVHLAWDGYTLQLQGRPPVPLPQLQGAITARWIVPASEHTVGMQAPPPRAAGMTIRPADGGNPMDHKPRMAVTTAQEEERHVGNVQQHANQVRSNNNNLYQAPNSRGVVVELEEQDGIPVRQLGSPDGRKNPTEVTASSIGTAIRQAESVRVQPGQGRTREEVMAAMNPEQRAAYEAELAARRAMHVGLDNKVAVQNPHVVAGPENQGQVVGRIETQKTAHSEGITTTNQVGGGTDTVDLGGTGGEAHTQVVEQEGIKFTQTNGPRQKPQQQQAPAQVETDPRRVIAKSICADFPDVYDFDASVRKKIARIQADFEDRPDIIKAVAAAETDAEMRERLVQEFPDAFQ